jgi:hypothetical protein
LPVVVEGKWSRGSDSGEEWGAFRTNVAAAALGDAMGTWVHTLVVDRGQL